MERSRHDSSDGSKRPGKVMWSFGSMDSRTGPMRRGSATLPFGRPDRPTEKAQTGWAISALWKRSVKSTASSVQRVM